MLDDGRPLAESNAILWYFADGTQYLPGDGYERAQVLRWMLFEQHTSMPNIALMRFWLRWAPQKPGEAEMEPRRRAGYAALDAMEGHLASREFLVGDGYSIADIALYGYTHVAEGLLLARWLPRDRRVAGARPLTAGTRPDHRLTRRATPRCTRRQLERTVRGPARVAAPKRHPSHSNVAAPTPYSAMPTPPTISSPSVTA